MGSMTPPNDFDARLQAFEDRLIKFMAHEFEAVRHDFGNEFEAVRRDLRALERQVGFMHEVTSALVRQNTAMEADAGVARHPGRPAESH